MHWFDISIIVVLAASTVYSLIRGLTKELFSLIAFTIAFILAHRYYALISSMILGFISSNIVADLLSFGFIFIFSALIVSQIGKLVRKLLYETKTLTITDRVGGGLLGLIKGILIIAVIMIPIGLIPFAKKTILSKSKLASFILNISRQLSKASFSDENILDNVQTKIMKNMQDKLKIPEMKGKIKTRLDAIVGSLKDRERDSELGKDNGKSKDRAAKSAREKDKGDDNVSDEITEEDKKKLKKLLDQLIGKNL